MINVYRIGRDESPPEAQSAEAALKSVMKVLRQRLEESGAKVKIMPLPPCKAASGTLENIFTNLVMNSIVYRDVKRKLAITVRGENSGSGSVVYSVSDNGRGIKDRDMPRIFQIFYRGNNPDLEPGEGIGLPLARTLAERSGGRVWAESKEGEGSVFYVEMPGECGAQ